MMEWEWEREKLNGREREKKLVTDEIEKERLFSLPIDLKIQATKSDLQTFST